MTYLKWTFTEYNEQLLIGFYVGLVRAHLSYATQVWAPQGIELISKLESIQRRATKFILCLPF